MNQDNPLEQPVRDSLERYFAELGDAPPHDILDMVMHCIERPVIEVALEKSGGNQSRAAEMLGITRGTLRKKLVAHGLRA